MGTSGGLKTESIQEYNVINYLFPFIISYSKNTSMLSHHKIKPSKGMFLKGEFGPKIKPSPRNILEVLRRRK